MLKRVLMTSVLGLGLILAGCGGETGTELNAETAEAVDQIETELQALGQEIEASEFRADLEAAWDSVEEEVTGTVDSIRSGEALDTQAVEQQLDAFQEALDSVEAEQTLRDAWTELRTSIESLIADLG